MSLRVIPNLLTLVRILLAAPLVWLLATRQFETVLLLFAVAGISDALDGHLARRYNWTSRLGAILDPLADKALLVCSFVMLGWLGLLPMALVALVITRDIVIVGGAVAYHLLIGRVDMSPTLVSKANTALQILLVLLVLFGVAFQAVPTVVIDGIALGVVVTTLASGVDYVWSWSRRARQALAAREKERNAQ